VELILNGEKNQVVGLNGCEISGLDLKKSATSFKPLDLGLLQLARELAT
jgi:hypothetical protein